MRPSSSRAAEQHEATAIFAVSPDARWALVTEMGLHESDIMLVENFR